MTKRITSLNIDEEVINEAKRNFINMSELAERAIKEKLGKKEVEIDERILNCEFCDREGEKENINTLNKKDSNLTWLYPDERWICNRCLRDMTKNITKP